jgi:acyl-CoA dehydrogenase
MENELAVARLACADMVAAAAAGEPSPNATNRIMIGRTRVASAAIRTVDKAMEVLSGSALYGNIGLEHLFRDVQGARYHPPQQKAQHRYAGRLALRLDIDG